MASRKYYKLKRIRYGEQTAIYFDERTGSWVSFRNATEYEGLVKLQKRLDQAVKCYPLDDISLMSTD